MAKKDYSKDPPDHFREVFHESCLSCEELKWHPKYWYICIKHGFRFGSQNLGRHGDPKRRKCDDYSYLSYK